MEFPPKDGSKRPIHKILGRVETESKQTNLSKYFNNRIINRSNQLHYWRLNWRSGLIRLLERILIGVNISDRLGGDLGHFLNSSSFSAQVIDSHVLNEASVLNTIFIRPLGSADVIELPGISKERRIIQLSGASVDSYSGLIRTDSGFVIDSALSQWQKLIYMGGLPDAYASTTKRVETIKGSWAVLPHSDYYFHTLTEGIATLLAIKEQNANFGVVVFKDAPSWALELLTELGFEYMVTAKRGIRIENLLTATGVGCFSSNDFKRFARYTRNKKDSDIANIFVSRRNLSRSDEALEASIISELGLDEFKIINPEEFSVKEQMAIFQAATKIVSFHGGALSNLVWCKKGTKVLEIFNHPYRSYDFARLAHEGNLSYYALDAIDQQYNKELLEGFIKG